MRRDRISRFGGKMLPLRRKSARGVSKIHSDLDKRCKNCGEELRGSIAPDGFCVEKQHVGLGFGGIFCSVGLGVQAVFRSLGAPFVLADLVAGVDPVRESGGLGIARIGGGGVDGVVGYGRCLEIKTSPRKLRGDEKEELR